MQVLFQNMPPLSPEEYTALEQSIIHNGIQVPILLDERGTVIDGHHRQKIAQHLGIKCPSRTVSGKTETEKRTLALSLNLDRRHLTREQRRTLAVESLKADPELSNRQHAERVGVDHKTIQAVRAPLVERGEIPHVETRMDSLGRQQPAERIDPNTGEVLDGKTYPRPEPKEHKETTMTTAPTRLAIPQPPRYGGNRLKHKQIIANAITAGNGMRIALDEIADKGLDGSITTEEADQYAADLSEILRSLKRIQSLLKKEV